MKPLWTGAIGFGLVNIPVKLYSATESRSLDLDMLDKIDQSNIKFKRVNENTGKEVKWENIVKGYKLDNNKYVILDDKDFEKANSVKSKLIEISEFVDAGEINSAYYDTPYYLAPDKSGIRPYALLREALLKTNKVGVSTFVLRNKEALAILRGQDDVIILNKIRFHHEIKSTSPLELPKKAEVKPAELKMAINLIEQLSGKFDIEKFKDNYNDELLKLIEAKAKGVKPKATHMKVVHSKATDLMDQLKASLSTTTKRKKAS